MSLERRQQELELLRSRNGRAEHGPNLDWILFPDYTLPPGWNRDRTELLILIPAGYPATPPDNFYVREGLRLADGRLPNNYSEGQTVLGGRWSQFSFHAQSWHPTSDAHDGDNLLTFSLAVDSRLREGA
jgi:hypothetical protein